MSRVVIGIDPGHTGAVAILVDGKVEIHDAPVVDVSGRRSMDLHAMVRIFRDLTLRDEIILNRPHVFIERVHSFPGSSARSMFTFGQGYGEWRGVIVALGFPLTAVDPAVWKAAIMNSMGKEKDAARFRAALLFPAYAHLFARKQDDGRAEALLIAEYGRRTL